MIKKYSRQQGFSLVELLIVLTIMGIIFSVAVPFYRKYVAQTELRTVSQELYTELITAHNNAVNGVVPKDVAAGNTDRYYWVVHVHKNGTTWEHETGACTLKTTPPATATEYANQFSFNFCDRHDYTFKAFPANFDISHQYSTASEVNIYFEPISGNVAIYDISGTRLDSTSGSAAIDMVISATDYSALQTTINLNHQGTVRQTN